MRAGDTSGQFTSMLGFIERIAGYLTDGRMTSASPIGQTVIPALLLLAASTLRLRQLLSARPPGKLGVCQTAKIGAGYMTKP